MSPVLELDRVVRRYTQADGSELTILDSVSLGIGKGETVSVAGRSGSGKSTLLHIAAGIEIPSEGTVRLGERDLAGLSDPERSRLRGRFVGLVFQFFHLVPYLTVRENVLLPARIARVHEVPGEAEDPTEVSAAADRLLAAVGLEGRAREPARRLSGGEMQRTAIARALLLGPALLLADEPTGNLDARGAGTVADLLFRLVRDRGAGFRLFRTVHHIDDFTTPALIECQDAAITEPDRVLVVSEPWRRRLLDDYGVEAAVVTNGVRVERFAGAAQSPEERDALRSRIDASERHLFLTVGGIEPRKGSRYLVEALGLLKAVPGPRPMLAVVGGHSFQDYRAYRDEVLGSLGSHGLRLGDDVVLVGTVPDAELPGWFGAADSFVFPSISEGWGLVVLEALAAGLPVVASDIPGYRALLLDGEGALLVPPKDDAALARTLLRLMRNETKRVQMSAFGEQRAQAFAWPKIAARVVDYYEELLNEREIGGRYWSFKPSAAEAAAR